MRQLLIARIISYLNASKGDHGRWAPVKEWIFRNMLKKDPTTKAGRKECARYDLSNLELLTFASNCTNEELLDLLCLVVHRAYQQR